MTVLLAKPLLHFSHYPKHIFYSHKLFSLSFLSLLNTFFFLFLFHYSLTILSNSSFYLIITLSFYHLLFHLIPVLITLIHTTFCNSSFSQLIQLILQLFHHLSLISFYYVLSFKYIIYIYIY